MLEPNTILQNRYLIVSLLGQGGMGAVYMATDQRFGSTVALKQTLVNGDSLRKAFEREARLLNGLRHAALPVVIDYFTEGEEVFLVMQYIAGDDLNARLEKSGGPFRYEEVLLWADQLLDALDFLHTHQPPIIHRDIKPQNLKVTPRGEIILLDFGLAKGSAELALSTSSASIFGYTPTYAPFEQIQGAGTDARSDIYSGRDRLPPDDRPHACRCAHKNLCAAGRAAGPLTASRRCEQTGPSGCSRDLDASDVS
jgi:serine/threonine protein kinase